MAVRTLFQSTRTSRLHLVAPIVAMLALVAALNQS